MAQSKPAVTPLELLQSWTEPLTCALLYIFTIALLYIYYIEMPDTECGVNHVQLLLQGSFCACAHGQPMTDYITMQRRLSLAWCIHKMIPEFNSTSLYTCWHLLCQNSALFRTAHLEFRRKLCQNPFDKHWQVVHKLPRAICNGIYYGISNKFEFRMYK